MTRLGFILSTTFLIIYQAWILEARQWLRNIILGAFFSTAVYFIFVRLLNILLPAGILG
ncbi:MAG: tripartite tricarboxylate transporter TctB family protein [Thermodesulfobacteriota bacterium]|nr:tripartite tricarboxylate transporter TctB family protein [Thermodesulfobacteriota bacterium]